MSQLKCEKVSLGYEGKAVVSGIDFSLHGGEYLVIVGENGAGKSTLLKGLLHLKKPMEGKILYGNGLKGNEIGYLPQQSMAQKDFPASVKEVVMSGRLNHMGSRPFYNKADKKRAYEAMILMGISNLMHESYQNLSGGQQQRVLLARALCATRKMILLDEPVAGLDPKATGEMYEMIAKINRQMGITIIMVSHDIRAALSYATHVLHVDHEQTFFGKLSEYYTTPMGAAFASAGEEVRS